jgi:excisionase family DNA binding protein
MSDLTYTPQQAADKLQVHRRTVLAWIRSGDLKAVRLGGHTLRITEEQLREFMKRQTEEGMRPPDKRILEILGDCECQGQEWQSEFGELSVRCGICETVYRLVKGEPSELVLTLQRLIGMENTLSSWLGAYPEDTAAGRLLRTALDAGRESLPSEGAKP